MGGGAGVLGCWGRGGGAGVVVWVGWGGKLLLLLLELRHGHCLTLGAEVFNELRQCALHGLRVSVVTHCARAAASEYIHRTVARFALLLRTSALFFWKSAWFRILFVKSPAF